MKLAIVTGASTGIGRATAERFVTAGYRVLNLARRTCDATGVENLCSDLTTCLAEADFCEKLVDHVREAEAVCLVHNAAILQNDTVRNTPDAEFAAVLDLNVRTPNRLNHLLLPHLPAGSSIIYIGSTLAEKAVPNAFSYVVSKHAIVGMMRATAQDLAGAGIHTACVCPGFTDTEMLRAHVGDDPQTLAAIAAMNAFGRLITPAEIADLVIWAAEHPVINGAVLHAHLGQIER